MNSIKLHQSKILRLCLTLSLLLGLLGPWLSGVQIALPLANPQIPVAAAAASKPVLLVYNDSYTTARFGRYLGEIMQAEGYNLFDTVQLSSVTGTLLSGYDTVVLAQTSLTSSQSTTFTQYVSNGGNLIAMRPDTQLNTVFGLSGAAGTLNNGYMAIQGTSVYGQGFPGDSLQLHTAASQYSTATGQVVAYLYSDANTATTYPAVVVNSYGSGKAAAFTYDLATSVVYIRQGNPNQTDVDVDNDGAIRTGDMYDNWVDLNKMPLPQADLHQRLFARILSKLNAAKKPLPNFWYFPNGKNTVVVLTSDAHNNPDDYYQNVVTSMNKFNVKTTVYWSGGPPSESLYTSMKDQGYSFSTHPYMVDNPLDIGLTTVEDNFTSTYNDTYGKTTRIHRLQWQGWVDAGKVEVDHGYQMDYSYYRYGPWLQKPDNTWARGYMTGSGLPMKLIDATGQVVNLFAQYTELADDQMLDNTSGPEHLDQTSAIVYTRQAIDSSEAGNNQAVAFQMHVDYYYNTYHDEQTWAEDAISYTKSLNIPIFSGEDWNTFTQNRYNSTFTNISWANSKLGFTANIPAGQSGQAFSLPARTSAGVLSAVTVNGVTTPSTLKTVRGEDQAFVTLPAGTSTVSVTYTPDLTQPVISNISAIPGLNQAQVTWTTNEAANGSVNYGTTTAMTSNASVSAYTTNHAITLSGLITGTTYYYQVVSSDQSGNTATSAQSTFRTAGDQVVENSYAQFSNGTFSGTFPFKDGSNNYVRLASSLDDNFTGSSINGTRWGSGSYVGGGGVTVAGDIATLNGGFLKSVNTISAANRSLSARLKFTSGVGNQHFGLSPDLGSNWIIFSIPNYDPANLYARTNYGPVNVDQKLTGIDLSQFHNFEIDLLPGSINYLVDGVIVASHNATFSGSMPVWLSSANLGGQIQVDWVNYNEYPASGTFISEILDAGNAVSWAGINSTGTLNNGTIQLQTRTSTDKTNWSAWSAATSSNSSPITSPPGRYLQYQATFQSSDSTKSPFLTSVTAGFNVLPASRVTISPTTATVPFGSGFQFSATAYDASDNVLPGATFNWSVANGGGVIDANGVFTGTASGTYNNTVVAANSGKTATATVTVGNPPPGITTISPNLFLNTSDTTITITGTNFIATPTVKLGTINLTGVTYVSPTKLTVTVPAGTTPGNYDLTITNPDGFTATLTQGVMVTLPPPTITSVTPNSRSNSASTVVTIQGTNFVNLPTIKLGTNVLSGVTFISNSKVTAVIPAGLTPATYDITLVNPAGETVTASNAFTVGPPLPVPSISRVKPATVGNGAATTLTIEGSSFTDPMTVALDGVNLPASAVTVVSNASIQVTLPANYATGTYDVSVTDSNSLTGTLANGLVVLPAQSIIQTSQSDFASGTFTSTVTTGVLDGEIQLQSGLQDYFSGYSLDTTQWMSANWVSNGTTTVANGSLTVSGSYVRSLAQQPVSSKLQARLKFSSDTSARQHFGFSSTTDLSSNWMLFSMPNGQLYARTNFGGVYMETLLSVSLDVYHDFMIDTSGGSIRYYVDGALVATHPGQVSGSAYIWFSSGGVNTPLSSESVQIASPYQSSGSYLSRVLDAGQLVHWNTLNWQASGNTVTVKARSSNDATTWSAWSPSTPITGDVSLSLPDGRYFQYQLDLSTADTSQSPVVQSVAAIFSTTAPGTLSRIVVSPASTSVEVGATKQFTAQGFDINNIPVNGLTFTWSTSGGGTINSASGLYTAGSTPGNFAGSVIATSGTITGSANVVVTLNAPSTTSVSPDNGPANNATTITLTGNNYVAGTTAQLGTTALTGVTYVSATKITAVVPAGLALGLYDLTVTNPDGQSTTLVGAYTVGQVAPKPVVNLVTPSVTTNTASRVVTLSGSNFIGPVGIALSGVNVPGVTFINASTVTFNLAANYTPGTYDITVTNGNGQSATVSNGLVVLPQAVINNTYTDFAAAASVFTSTIAASRVDGEIKLSSALDDFFVGSSLNSTTWATDIWTSGGSAIVNNGSVTVVGAYAKTNNAYAIDHLKFKAKFASGLPNQHIGFSPDLSSNWMIFSVPGFDTSKVYARSNVNGISKETPLNVTLDSFHDFQIVVTATAIQYFVDGNLVASHDLVATGTNNIWISNATTGGPLVVDNIQAGDYATSGSFLSAPLDAVDNLNWSKLNWQLNLPAGTTASIQARTSTDATNWSAWSSPATTAGDVPLSLVGGRYLQYLVNLTTSDVSQSPEVLSVAGLTSPLVLARIDVTPATANLLAGATQQFSAQGYDSANTPLTGVTYTWSTTGGGTINSSGLYTAGATAGSFPASVVATRDSITGSAGVVITLPAPTITAISPVTGANNVTTTITISGTNFAATPTVKLGTTSLTGVTLVSATRVTAVVPAGLAAGVYNLTLTNPDNQQVSLTNAYTVVQPAPTVTAISPSTGANNIANTITITGTNFVATPTVKLGSTSLGGVTFVSATKLTAVVPAGFATGAFTLTVTNPDNQQATLANAYTSTLQAPTVTSIAPVTGINNVANTINITGTNFVATPGVKLGTTSLTNVTFVSATRLTAVVPVGLAAGVYSLVVTNPDNQQATLANAYTSTLPAPTITTIAPNNRDNAIIRTVTITGTNFVATPAVKLGSNTLPNVTFVSATRLTAQVPAGFTPGTYALTVTNPDGKAATLNNAYTATAAPNLSQNTANFSAGTFSGTGVTLSGSTYEVGLTPSFEDEFTGSSLNNLNWTFTSTGFPRGSATVTGNGVSVKGGFIRSRSNYTRSVIEGRVIFPTPSSGTSQDFGWGSGTNSLTSPWAMFGVPSSNPNGIYARTNIGSTQTDTRITSLSFNTYYNLRVVVGTTTVTYYVNNVQVAQHTVSSSSTNTGLNIFLYNSNSSTGSSNNLQADWIRVDNFPSTGKYTSTTFDSGSSATTWTSLNWAGNLPTGTGISVQVQTSTNGFTWNTLSSGMTTPGTDTALTGQTGRYLRYVVTFTPSSDATFTPTFSGITLTYTTQSS
ncbi:MAG: IPT/TIG domain-containing protein [Chloroflexi bacterium]|nr:IPT/TIG domain-containing protein [Chloroflexota bacterium]OJW03432.1 MAG: hypothetical protein BGO39_10510 [Chloroflexi bacterium 54-19]